ncbi:MAG: ABC transporter permease [Eubacteriales bacterium]|nr:ABC transporter permease [Eubacteriales bacterium]
MKRKVFAYPYIVWMILFIVVPMLFLFYYMGTENGTFTFARCISTITDASNWKVLGKSVLVALVTTVICLILGYPAAYILSRMKKTVASFLSVLFFIPMWMNFVLRTYAWKSILSMIPNLFGTAPLLGTTEAVILVLVYNFLPFMVIPLYNTLSKMDRSLIEASRDLGANGFQTFTRVVLPLSIPGIVSGVTMVLIPAITAFTVPVLIGNSKESYYGNLIEDAFKRVGEAHGGFSTGSTLAVILLICVLVSTLVMNHFDKDKEGGTLL